MPVIKPTNLGRLWFILADDSAKNESVATNGWQVQPTCQGMSRQIGKSTHGNGRVDSTKWLSSALHPHTQMPTPARWAWNDVQLMLGVESWSGVNPDGWNSRNSPRIQVLKLMKRLAPLQTCSLSVFTRQFRSCAARPQELRRLQGPT